MRAEQGHAAGWSWDGGVGAVVVMTAIADVSWSRRGAYYVTMRWSSPLVWGAEPPKSLATRRHGESHGMGTWRDWAKKANFLKNSVATLNYTLIIG